MKKLFTYLAGAILLMACNNQKECQHIVRPNPSDFDTVLNGKQVSLYTLKNANGTEVYITNYGAIIVAVLVPDKNGKLGDVTLGRRIYWG